MKTTKQLDINSDSQVVSCWEKKNDYNEWVRFNSNHQKILENAWLQNRDEITLTTMTKANQEDTLVVCLRSLGGEYMCYRNPRTGVSRDVRRIVVTLTKTETASWLEEEKQPDLSRSMGVKMKKKPPPTPAPSLSSTADGTLQHTTSFYSKNNNMLQRNNLSEPHSRPRSTLLTQSNSTTENHWRKQNPTRVVRSTLAISSRLPSDRESLREAQPELSPTVEDDPPLTSTTTTENYSTLGESIFSTSGTTPVAPSTNPIPSIQHAKQMFKKESKIKLTTITETIHHIREKKKNT